MVKSITSYNFSPKATFESITFLHMHVFSGVCVCVCVCVYECVVVWVTQYQQ